MADDVGKRTIALPEPGAAAGRPAKRSDLRQSLARPALIACTLIMTLAAGAQALEPKGPALDKRDNGLWMRRHWLHEDTTPAEIAALVENLRARGIKRIYPFLGPPDGEGWPGWRSKAGIVRYSPARVAVFFEEMHRIAPEIRVLPWSGGVLDGDVNLKDESKRRAFVEHAKRLVALGAGGIHLNIEPLPSGNADYLALLREVKAAIGDRTLSVAAYPPPTPLQPVEDVHWRPPFMRDVCATADELAVMAYNTGETSAPAFKKLAAEWTRDLGAALRLPKGGGCEWLMGVPAYDDDKDYHRPDVETIENSLKGIIAGLMAAGEPENFRGVAIYASFTMDERKWAVYDRLWRGVEPVALPPPDLRNTSE